MKKNLLIKLFLTAVITHFSLYCSEPVKKVIKKASEKAAQRDLDLEARWAKLLEANPYQARPMPVTPAQSDHIFKASSAVQFRSNQYFPSVQPIPAAPQHIHAVQPAKSQELPLEVFFAQEDYQAWQKLETYLQQLKKEFPQHSDAIEDISNLWDLAKMHCALEFYPEQEKQNGNSYADNLLRLVIDAFNILRSKIDQGKEDVPNEIEPIKLYLSGTHYYRHVIAPKNTPPATQSGVICYFCAKVFNSDHMLKRHVRNSHQVEEAHKKDLANKTTSGDITVSKI